MNYSKETNDSVVYEERKRKYVTVDYGVLHDTEYLEKVYDKMVYVLLCKYADFDDKTSFPSVKTIAKQCLCSENTVRSSIKTLEKHGLIKVDRRYDPISKTNTSNLYTILTVPDKFPDFTYISRGE